MKRSNNLLLAFLGLMLFSSCEKIIELEITDSEKKVIIEAELVEGVQQFDVLVTESTFYDEVSASVPLNDANVTLEDDQGLSVSIPFVSNGLYSLNFTAVEGRTYKLSVDVNGETYTAQSTMAGSVQIEDLTADFEDLSYLDISGYRVKCVFTDPVGEDNFYRIRHLVNQTPQNEPSDFVVFSDDLKDGLNISRIVSRDLFQTNETVLVELIQTDESTNEYLSSLADIIGSSPTGGSAAPSNPETNWSNGAMGIFSTYNIDTMSIVIP